MIRSASARTDRRIEPIEQLVSLRAIPGMVVIRPADANEMTEAYRVHPAAAASPGGADLLAAGTADRRSHAVRPGRRSGERRLCAGRCAGRQAGRDPDRQRQRSRALPGGARAAGCRRRQDACRQHAVMGAVRGAGRGISRQRAAARGDGAGDRRGRLAARLAALCRACRRRLGHAHVRHVGTDEGGCRAFRLHHGWRRGRRQAGHGSRTRQFEEDSNGTGHDRPGPHGREHGRAPDEGRARLRRL